MKIIVGLGNPEKRYEKTRHNAGFLVLDEIAKKWRLRWQADRKLGSLKARRRTESTEIILAKPQTFMNESGRAVKKIVQKFKGLKGLRRERRLRGFEDLWVIHDDLDLPLGKLKIVKDRGAAGHKGVESIIKELGTKEFVRFRVGIGKIKNSKLKIQNCLSTLSSRPKGNLKFKINNGYKDYVLEEFKGKEKEILEKMVEKCSEAVLLALGEGLEKAMNKYN